ncbi:MAG: hypothetical protein WED10_13720, partial [Brumimicrobium sp.]
MIKHLRHLRNKYILTLVVFAVYMLFLDDVDVFTIAKQEIKLNKLQQEKVEIKEKYLKTKATLDQLDNME